MAEDPNYIKEVKRFIQDIPKAKKNCHMSRVCCTKASLKLFIKEEKYGNDWPTCQKITHVDANVAVMFE